MSMTIRGRERAATALDPTERHRNGKVRFGVSAFHASQNFHDNQYIRFAALNFGYDEISKGRARLLALPAACPVLLVVTC